MQLAKLVKRREAEAKRADRMIAAFRKKHPRFDELRDTMMTMLARGTGKTTGEIEKDLKAAYRAALKQRGK